MTTDALPADLQGPIKAIVLLMHQHLALEHGLQPHAVMLNRERKTFKVIPMAPLLDLGRPVTTAALQAAAGDYEADAVIVFMECWRKEATSEEEATTLRNIPDVESMPGRVDAVSVSVETIDGRYWMASAERIGNTFGDLRFEPMAFAKGNFIGLLPPGRTRQ
jgi:hypothetical protein